MKWNADIRESLDSKLIQGNEHIEEFLDEWLPTTEITEAGYDYSTAKICECIDEGPTCFELNIYCYESYGTVYHWVRPSETEEEYKKRRVKVILDELSKKTLVLGRRIERMYGEFNSLFSLRLMFDK